MLKKILLKSSLLLTLLTVLLFTNANAQLFTVVTDSSTDAKIYPLLKTLRDTCGSKELRKIKKVSYKKLLDCDVLSLEYEYGVSLPFVCSSLDSAKMEVKEAFFSTHDFIEMVSNSEDIQRAFLEAKYYYISSYVIVKDILLVPKSGSTEDFNQILLCIHKFKIYLDYGKK